jgi:hypothetical protein
MELMGQTLERLKNFIKGHTNVHKEIKLHLQSMQDAYNVLKSNQGHQIRRQSVVMVDVSTQASTVKEDKATQRKVDHETATTQTIVDDDEGEDQTVALDGRTWTKARSKKRQKKQRRKQLMTMRSQQLEQRQQIQQQPKKSEQQQQQQKQPQQQNHQKEPQQQQRYRQQRQQQQQQNGGKQLQKSQQQQQMPRVSTYEISEDGRSFSDVVKRLKHEVPQAAEVDIISVRKTKGGKVEVRARDPGKTLLNGISSLSGVKSHERVQTSFIHIRGMDVAVTEDEVKTAVAKTLDCDEGSVMVTSMRPAYGDSQKATIKLPWNMARELLKKEKVRIGWVQCRVYKRVEEKRCYRCWNTGHEAARCNGADRRPLCFNCGEEDHKVSTCTNSTKCLNCGEMGHRTMRCVVGLR